MKMRETMKKLTILLLTLFLFSSTYAEIRTFDELEFRDGIPYAVGEKTPFTGEFIGYHFNGNKRRIVNYKNGWVDGTKTFFDSAGNKIAEGNYTQDKKNGIWTIWRHNGGHKKSEVTYVDDHQQGKETNWHENGKKKSEGLNRYYDWTDSRKDGLWTTWYDNGQIESKGKWVVKNRVASGRKNGKWEEWYKNSNKKTEVEYRDGLKIGAETTWHENGNKKKEIRWGSITGVWDKQTNYSVDGQILFKEDRRFENKKMAFLNKIDPFSILVFCLFLMLVKGASLSKIVSVSYLAKWTISLIIFSLLIYWNVMWTVGGLLGTPGPENYYYFIAIYLGLFTNYLSALKPSKNKKSMLNLFITPLLIFFLSIIGCNI